jgi:PAS domain S-box-containing protein
MRKTLKEGYSNNHNYRIMSKGSYIPVEMNSTVILDSNHELTRFICVIRDVTERVSSEKELLEKTKQLSERVRELKCLYDFHYIVFDQEDVNAAMQDLTEVIAQSFQYPEDACVEIQLYDRIFKNKQLEKSEWSLSSSIETSGRVIGCINVFYTDDLGFLEEETALLDTLSRNIADYVDREENRIARRESEAKYRQLLETIKEGIWVLDTSAITTYVNQEMANMLGYSEQEMIGTSLFDYMDAEAKERALALMRRRMDGISDAHEFTFLRKDGIEIIAFLRTAPILNSDSEVIGAIAAVTDITVQKEAELELKSSERRYRTLVESMTDMIFVLDADDKIVEYYGPMDTRFTANLEQAFHKHPLEYLPEESANLFLEASKNVRETGNSLTYI